MRGERKCGSYFSVAPKSAILWNVGLSASIMAMAAAISLPGPTSGGRLGMWLILLAAEALGWRRVCHVTSATEEPSEVAPMTRADVIADTEEVRLDLEQQQLRGRDESGHDCAEGWVRARFQSGQRTVAVHVAFCPPFSKAPQFAARQLDGRSSRVRVSHVFVSGARLEVKLDAVAAGPESVRVAFTAVDGAPSRPAASS